jgi:membrane associated rhomboid family serine protease
MTFFTELHSSFRQGSMLRKLLYLNIGVFIVVRLGMIILKLCALDSIEWISYLELPANLHTLALRPWTLASYMFLHIDFLHILFNMLCLFGFGQLFLHCFSQKQLLGIYIFGGIGGALVYVVAFNIFPFFIPIKDISVLLGASASIMAIIVAVATYSPNFEVPLLLIGQVKLKYVAIFAVGISMLGIASDNAGGELAHLGGALTGFWFARRIHMGKDVTKQFNQLINKIITLFERKPKSFKVTKLSRSKNDMEYRQERRKNEDELNRILDKVKRSGYGSLTTEEKKSLFDRSNPS